MAQFEKDKLSFMRNTEFKKMLKVTFKDREEGGQSELRPSSREMRLSVKQGSQGEALQSLAPNNKPRIFTVKGKTTQPATRYHVPFFEWMRK